MEGMFEKYVNMIRERAHQYSVKYNIDYSELESQGFLIYCECLKRYDVTKANFSTFLFIQLTRLNDYAKTYKRQQGVTIQDYYGSGENTDKNYEEEVVSREMSPTLNDFLADAEKELSSDAFRLLVWIVRREWERKNKRTPTIQMAMKHFNSTKEVIEELWNELKMFWNSAGIAFYA